MPVKNHMRLISVLSLLLLAAPALAQTSQDIPRFAGSNSSASSTAAEDPGDPQRSGSVSLPGAPQASLPVQNLPQALIGEAALEAAREEGRRFVDRRYWREWFYGD